MKKIDSCKIKISKFFNSRRLIGLTTLLLMFIMASLFAGCNQTVDSQDDELIPSFGVWWWDKDLDADTYLNFAIENGVNEIYYCNWSFDEQAKTFLQKCKSQNISVYLLDGNYKWLTDTDKKARLIAKLDAYQSFQNENDVKFDGVHLDIEPHQSPSFESEREELITRLISLANELNSAYPNIHFEYDLPFWLDDEIEYLEETKPAYQHIIDVADRVTVMSYRDTAQQIYSVGEDELTYALAQNKRINLSVELGDVGEDIVSFFEEGKQHFENELATLKSMLDKRVGIVVHHIESWYNLN